MKIEILADGGRYFAFDFRADLSKREAKELADLINRLLAELKNRRVMAMGIGAYVAKEEHD